LTGILLFDDLYNGKIAYWKGENKIKFCPFPQLLSEGGTYIVLKRQAIPILRDSKTIVSYLRTLVFPHPVFYAQQSFLVDPYWFNARY
jgi:hypothetical protein